MSDGTFLFICFVLAYVVLAAVFLAIGTVVDL
jgi:hypothetical protein